MTSSIPFYSTVTQDIRDGLTLDAQYWGKNLRQPVNFMTTIQRLLESEHTVFIELSPHPILLSAIEEICHHLSKPGYGIASLRRDQPEVKTMLAELGLLYKFGYSVDWNKLHPEGGKLIALPGYAWQRERYWFDTSQADTNQSYLAGKIEHPLLGYRLPSLAHLSGHHIWQNKFPSLRRYLSARSSNLAEPIFREMALAAANIALGSKNHVISRFNISEPALKSENGETILQSTLVQNGSSATFELFSRKDEMSAWRRHLTAEIRIGDVDNSWFYNLVWEASSLSSSKLDESLMDGGYWLILSDCLGVGEELAARLKDHGANCRVISSSDTLIDFDRMLDGLEEEASIRIVYLWGLDLQPNHQLTSLGMAADQNSSVEALISLMQAIIRQRWSHMPSLFAVTQGSQVTSTEQPELMPSLMWGLGRVLALEHPDLWHKIIDLPTGEPVQSLADTLLVEIFQHDGEDQIVYRGEQRYVPRLVPADHSESAAHPFTVTSDGAYLITGGLGMLGIQLSHWLVDHGAKHLVLTSRNGLPDRSEWSSIAPGTLVSQRISAVQGLEETGVQVSVVQADVSDDSAMKQLFVQFGKSLPPLRGVIHAAGTNANQVFTELDLNTWREVLLPKVAGAWILHNLTSELPLDFFVCFSSAASVWGSRGMAPYASANHFLDQLAYYRRVHKLPALTVNWGWWSGDGIATTQQSDLFAKVGLSTMPVGKALAALAHLIESDATQRVVADVDWNVFAPIYESQRERPFLNHIRPQKIDDPARPTTKMERNVFLEQLQAAAPEKHRDMLTDYIRQTTAEILGFDKSRLLNTREGFFKMGMDSLMTVQLRTRLESSLGCSLPPTIAFEYPTISQLAVYMLQDVLHLPAKTTNSEVTAQPDASVTDPELDALSDDNLLDLLDDELAKVENLTK